MTDRYFQASRIEIFEYLPKTFKRTLEIGCAEGRFSTDFLQTAEERWGVEPDAEAGAVAAENLTRLLVGTYDHVEKEIPDNYFDLVICNDVIEHMSDHDRFLEQIKEKLTKDGVIVGSVPNIRHFTALIKLLVFRDWPYARDGILDRTHLRFFTSKSLARSFNEHNYTIEKLRGIRSIVKDGVTGLVASKNIFVRAASLMLICITFGFYWDTQYPQIAFRVRRQD